MSTIETEEIEKSLLSRMLEDEEFCSRLDEMWKFTDSTKRECGIFSYLGLNEVTFSEIVKGESSSITVNTPIIMAEALIEKKGLLYFFAHTHPLEESSLLPSPSDLELLFDMRKGYERIGIGIKPIHAVIKPGTYRDQSSLQMHLYQEKTEDPILNKKETLDRAIETIDFIHSFPSTFPFKYEIAPGEFIEIERHIYDSDRVRMLDSCPLFNATQVTYHKDMRVNSGKPYTRFNYSNLERFAQSLKWNREVLEKRAAED